MNRSCCHISLKPLDGSERYPGYRDDAVRDLLGGIRVSPMLDFSRQGFFQESRSKTQGMSISGAQQKLSMRTVGGRLVPTVTGGEFILKPSPEAYPYAAENEHAAMVCGRLLGITTAKCGLVPFEGGELAYLTRRFDREAKGEKRHQEDLAQIFNLPSKQKYSGTYERAGRAIFEATGGKKAVIRNFIHRLLFAYLIGNDDLHLKNISLQRLPDNRGPFYDKLSPNYDVLFCTVFDRGEEGLQYLALGLLEDPEEGGELFSEHYQHFGYYTGADFITLGERLELPGRVVERLIDELLKNVTAVCELIDISFMPEEMKADARRVVQQRARALAHVARQ